MTMSKEEARNVEASPSLDYHPSINMQQQPPQRRPRSPLMESGSSSSSDDDDDNAEQPDQQQQQQDEAHASTYEPTIDNEEQQRIMSKAIDMFTRRAVALESTIDRLASSCKIYAPDWNRRYVLFAAHDALAGRKAPTDRNKTDLVLQRLRRSLATEMRFLHSLNDMHRQLQHGQQELQEVEHSTCKYRTNTRRTQPTLRASIANTYARIKSSNITHLIAVVKTLCHCKVKEVCDIGCSFAYTTTQGTHQSHSINERTPY
jgi:hypothetical protein